ncbi:hypothetical protein FGLOB1_7745 [Fusarium globosum]|uniref:MACPF domain-containing protein n=1 Tax=Fusarium globosum TaxID=78864 RepID=A0A8H5Y4R5_9HYPO|nr:hypothetical protein FGLOB1_7745 [Fusarium globosum]
MAASGITSQGATRFVALTADTLDPDTFDPLVPRVAQQAITRSPIRFPWQPRILPLGMFFRSAATNPDSDTGNPFASKSAFDAESLDITPVVFTAYDGSGSFRSSEVMSSSASTDHLSVGVGVGVDLVVLEASVSVHYDRDVMENRDSNKASVTTSYRAGSVAFVRPPELSADAFNILHNRGIDKFKSVFGDYYVGGYRIGADASVLLSTNTSSRSETETKSVKITVETWFDSYSEEEYTSSSSRERHAEVHLSAFSSIEQLLIVRTVQMETPEFQALLKQGRGIHQRAQGLEDQVARVLKDIGVREGKSLTPRECAQLCERAVVVELLLIPVECIRQVRYWTIAL